MLILILDYHYHTKQSVYLARLLKKQKTRLLQTPFLIWVALLLQKTCCCLNNLERNYLTRINNNCLWACSLSSVDLKLLIKC